MLEVPGRSRCLSTDTNIPRLRAPHVVYTGDLTQLTARLATYLEVMPAIKKHRFERGYLPAKWDLHIAETKARNTMVDKIVLKGKDAVTVIGFGDGDTTRLQIKGFQGPRNRLEQQLTRTPGALVFSIWERRTSMACNECWRRLSNVCAEGTQLDKEDSNIRRIVYKHVYKLLECRKRLEGEKGLRCGWSGDRDVNAARNMLMLLMCLLNKEDRPAVFSWLVKHL